MSGSKGMLAAALAGIALSYGAVCQAQTYPPEGYAPLLFDSADSKYVFRLNGVPWICRSDSFCKPVKIDGVADKDLAQATIESLGFAGARYFLAYRQPNFEKGKEVVLACTEERCAKLDATVGNATSLGTFQVKQGDLLLTRTAFLRQVEASNGRAQLLWCSENDCAELPVTRDAELYLSYMGSQRADGRSVAWLRDKSGAVLSCAQPEDGVSDQLVCEKSDIVLSDFPAPAATAAAPAMAPPPPLPAAPTAADSDRANLAVAIDRAITSGDFASADRLLADATRRYAGNAAWPPLQQKLAKARADREAQVRVAEARRLIAEARRFAQVGDFAQAEAMLQDADREAAGFAETAKARLEIAALRTERNQRYRERYQYDAAIDQAFAAEQFWEAERLLADYGQRFAQDDDYRARLNRLAQLRAAAAYQARLAEARDHISAARQAMNRNDFVEAERQLALADRAAPGFPEVGQARADLSRRRIAAQRQQDEVRQLLALIEAALQRRQFDEADRAIEEGRRRFGFWAGWADLQSRVTSARRGDARQAEELRRLTARALELVNAAQRSIAQGNFVAADRALDDAERIKGDLAEIAIARAELERAKADRARQDAEVRAVVASIDAALARRQFADAERLIADGSRRYPFFNGWAALSRRVADARRGAPAQPAPDTATAPPRR